MSYSLSWPLTQNTSFIDISIPNIHSITSRQPPMHACPKYKRELRSCVLELDYSIPKTDKMFFSYYMPSSSSSEHFFVATLLIPPHRYIIFLLSTGLYFSISSSTLFNIGNRWCILLWFLLASTLALIGIPISIWASLLCTSFKHLSGDHTSCQTLQEKRVSIAVHDSVVYFSAKVNIPLNFR